jgi:hypothetical protein
MTKNDLVDRIGKRLIGLDPGRRIVMIRGSSRIRSESLSPVHSSDRMACADQEVNG